MEAERGLFLQVLAVWTSLNRQHVITKYKFIIRE
jgi:hypothetical protein